MLTAVLLAVVMVACCCRCSRVEGSPTGAKQAMGAMGAMGTASLGVPMSPCPAVFRYERRGNGWAGVVTVPAPPTDMPLVLRVDLVIAAALTTKYAGTLQLQEGRKALLLRLSAEDRRPVRYTLRFPTAMPLPVVTRIHATGKDLCLNRQGQRQGPVTTTISLEHSVRPELVRTRPTSTQRPPGTVQLFLQNDGGDPSTTAAQGPDVAPANPGEDGVEDDLVCGRPVHHRLLVAGGGTSNPGDWPWLAAVFASTSLGLEYHCAGSLVSDGHVLTAAHCVERLNPESLLVYVGRHNVRKWTEQQAQAREVAVVHVHPDHQAANYTADVAVLQLSERVAYDWFVRPVCIDWSSPEDLDLVVGRVGTVVGWGRDEHGHVLSPEPRAARLPIVSQEACLRSRDEFVHVTSERTFCAGFRNGTGPCNGDSGSGLVLPKLNTTTMDSNNEPWFLRGVVSLSLMDGERRTCDLRHFVVFTDVAKFRGWLGAIVRPRPGRPGSAAAPAVPAASTSGAKQVETVETQTDPDLGDQPIWDSDPN